MPMKVLISLIACSVSGLIFFFLQTQHHHTVKGVETSLYLVLITACPSLAQLPMNGNTL